MRSILGWSMGLWGFQIIYFFAVGFGVFYFAAGALADVATHVDDIDAVGHVDFSFVHIVEHFLGPFRPDFIVSAVAEKNNADDDIAFEDETFLGLMEQLLEACASTQGYNRILFYLPCSNAVFYNAVRLAESVWTTNEPKISK